MTASPLHRAPTWWTLSVGWAGFIFWLSSRSDVPQPASWMPPQVDKLIHATLFAILAALLYAALRRSGLRPLPAGWTALALASAYGLVDEWHQLSVAGRASDAWDWVADTLGAGVALLMARRDGMTKTGGRT